MRAYREDLAYIHDAGFSGYTLGAAPGILGILRKQGIASGRVVELACGSGRLARELTRSGYDVVGIDQSEAMIRLARKAAPGARFIKGSLWRARLPACDAVVSTGECINYCFDKSAWATDALEGLFTRVHRALRPGGVYVFDFAHPGRLPKTGTTRLHLASGKDWAAMSATTGSRETLVRTILGFRKHGGGYRRSVEVHSLRLYRPGDVMQALRRCGFRARRLRAYGEVALPEGMAAVAAVKPVTVR
jgi:SAM-dependent methyltransferase